MAGYRITKGLILGAALLCAFLYPASSLMNAKKMQKLKENVKKLQEETERSLADNMINDDAVDAIMDDIVNMMNVLAEMLERLVPDMTPVHELMEDLTTFLEDSKTFVHKEIRKEAAALKGDKEKLKALQERIVFLEQSHTEL